jgi:hypothetical protein
MNRHFTILDIPQNPLVSSGLASHVVVRLQPVYRDHYIETGKLPPMFRDRTKRACYKLNINTSRIEFWQDIFKFTVTDQGITPDERDVHGAIEVDQINNALHQGILFVIGKNAQGDPISTQVRFVVGIATGAPERALAGEFNREEWLSAIQNVGPGLQDFQCLHVFP